MTNTSSVTVSGAVVQDTFTGNSDVDSDTSTAGPTGGASVFTASATAPGYNDIDDMVTLPLGRRSPTRSTRSSTSTPPA